ncbi:DNA polymerase III subunit gamma and tau [Actinoplanes sp. NPDC020271]|uniref:DNA polymerase III subunit gamma and tau n=1 Tax=Actinoplanes sp. NPDC020271 TaxID=3363896 RepID=UPI0037AE1026
MALALYRKYRPRTFAEVIGQEHVTEPLSQALRSGRLNHAYLFSGPRGCGKTSSARILARSLNCEQGPTPEPCGVCASCKSLANDGAGSIDVIEIDAASHGGVDDARELREKAFFAPANSRYKIYVIDEAHMVSSAGFNALLKLVEEPPEYVKFIFATTEPDKVLGTIRSRTHHYPFRLIPPATLRPYLQQLTEAEGVTVDPAVFPLVVRAGGGSARDTLSVLDQLIAGAGPDGVSYARAVSLLGVTDVALIDEMCDALADGDGAAAYQTIDRVAEAGHDPRRYASDLLERLRDLIVLQQVPDAVTKGLIDGPADQLDAMRGQAGRLGAATLSRCADIVHNGLVEMRGTTAPRLLLELITARMLLPGADDSTGALLQRLERLEKQGPISAVRGLADAPPPVAPAASPASLQALSEPALEDGPVPGGPGGGGLAAARAAAAAAARGRSGPARPVSPAPVAGAPAAAGVVAPVSAPPAAPASDAAASAGLEPVSAPSGSSEAVSAPSVAVEPVSGPPTASEPVSAVPAVSEPVSAVSAPVSAPPVVSEPASADPVAAEPVVSANAPAAEDASGAVPEVDWNRVADGPAGEYYDDEPPWDDEPPADPELTAPTRPQPGLPRVRTVWQAFGAKDSTIKVMQNSGIGLHGVDGDTVLFLAPTPRYAERFLTYTDLITTEFANELGGRWQIRCEVGDGSAEAPSRNAAPRSRPPAADQSAARRMPAGRPAAPASAAPERNTGRTESRPSRPQRPAATDSDDDWPASAAPVTSATASSPTPDAPSPGGNFTGSPAGRDSTAGRPVNPGQPASAGGDIESRSSGANAGPGGSSQPVTAAGDTDWPEPVRPGSVAPRPAPVVADDGWPEPVKPGSLARPVPGSTESQPTQAAAYWGADTTGAAAPPEAVSDGSDAVEPSFGGRALSPGSVTPDRSPEAVVPAANLPSADFPAGPAGSGGSGESPMAAAPIAPVATAAPIAPVAPAAPAVAAPAAPAAAAGAPAPPAAPAASAAPAAPARSAAMEAAPAASAAPAAPAVPARSAAMEAARAAAARGGNASPNSGLAAARAAAANAAKGAVGRTAAAPAPGAAGGGSAWSDGTPIGEAPYDPEYDGPPSAAGFEGFDPGDEPLDEVIDEKTARQSSEEQAFQLLRDAFGAEKIGEV